MRATLYPERNRPAGLVPLLQCAHFANLALVLTMIAVISQPTTAAAAEPCFYGEDAFTIQYKLSGTESGTLTEHVSACGRKRVEIQDSKISMMGITQTTKKRTIYEGAEIITIDDNSGAITKGENPLYAKLVASMEGKSGVEFGEQMMQQMGGRKTGETGNYAGQDCQMWEIASLGSKSCVTPWGATLFASTNVMGMASAREATTVKIGDAGPPAAYTYDESKAEQAPDVMKLLEQMKKMQNPNTK